MNLRALSEIIENNEHCLEETAIDNKIKPESVRAAALIVNDKGYDALIGGQKWVFDTAILPLIHDVQCEGYRGPLGEDINDCQNIIDDEILDDCYRDEIFLCENCQANAANDAYFYNKLMEE